MTFGRLGVAGGGLAGLLASAAAASYFDEVIVFDPGHGDDRLATGSPQAGQLHNVLTRGQQHLEELLPGFRDRLLDAGAVEGSVADDTHVFEFGGQAIERPLGMSIWSAPWHVLWAITRSLLPSNVRYVEASSVEGFVIDEDVVRRIVVRSGQDRSLLDVDGVVDASGYSTPASSLLEDARAPVPTITECRLDRWFVTVRLHRPPQWHGATDFWMVFTEPPARDVALLSPFRADEWILSVSSQSGRRPPRDLASVGAFLDDLPGPPLRPLVDAATPISVPTHFRRRTARWRHYEAIVEPLERFVPLGDSYAAINPVYGQGVGVAAWQASLLRDALRDAGPNGSWTRPYLAAAGDVVTQAWALDDVPVPLISVDEWSYLAGALSGNADLHRRYVALWHLVEPASTLPQLVDGVTASRIIREDRFQ